MSKPQYQYLAGYIVGLLLSLLLIHFLLANLFAQLLGISVWLSYTVLVALGEFSISNKLCELKVLLMQSAKMQTIPNKAFKPKWVNAALASQVVSVSGWLLPERFSNAPKC